MQRSVEIGNRLESALADFWFTGSQQTPKLFEDSLFAASEEAGTSFIWVIVSDEQRKTLSHRSARETFDEITDQMMSDLKEPLTALGIQKPTISFVNPAHVDRLYRWAQTRNLNPF